MFSSITSRKNRTNKFQIRHIHTSIAHPHVPAKGQSPFPQTPLHQPLASRSLNSKHGLISRVQSIYFLRFNLVVTLSILGSFNFVVILSFWLVTSLYLSPNIWDPFLFFSFSISLLSKNGLRVRVFKSITTKLKRKKYISLYKTFIKINTIAKNNLYPFKFFVKIFRARLVTVGT